MKLDKDKRIRLRAQLQRFHAENAVRSLGFDGDSFILAALDDLDELERRIRWHKCAGDGCPVCSLGARDDRIIYPLGAP